MVVGFTGVFRRYIGHVFGGNDGKGWQAKGRRVRIYRCVVVGLQLLWWGLQVCWEAYRCLMVMM